MRPKVPYPAQMSPFDVNSSLHNSALRSPPDDRVRLWPIPLSRAPMSLFCDPDGDRARRRRWRQYDLDLRQQHAHRTHIQQHSGPDLVLHRPGARRWIFDQRGRPSHGAHQRPCRIALAQQPGTRCRAGHGLLDGQQFVHATLLPRYVTRGVLGPDRSGMVLAAEGPSSGA